MDTEQPCLEIGKHEVDDGQESLGNFHVVMFRNGCVKIPACFEYRAPTSVVGDNGGS